MGRKTISFEEAETRLKSDPEFHYLELLTFEKVKGISKFNDKEFGIFYARFDFVCRGAIKHPERSKRNRINSYTEESRLKRINTNIIRYGGPSPMCSKMVQEKSIQTCFKNNGVFSPMQSSQIREKAEQTCLDNFGVKNPSQSQEIKDKKSETCFNTLGVNVPFKSEVVKEKSRKSHIKNRGVENPSQAEDVKLKKRERMFANETYNCIDGYSGHEYYINNNIQGTYGKFLFNLNEFGLDFAKSYTPNKDKTNIEQLIINILDKNNIKYDFEKYININGKKYVPDFILEDYKLIIECDGLYWHSDSKQVDNKYHKTKKEDYTLYGYKSLFFRSDEIFKKQNIIESLIKQKLLLNEVILAESCIYKNLKNEEVSLFFNENYLFESNGGKSCGLLFNNEIVCAIIYTIKNNKLKIKKFCSKINTNVIGGFEKLFNNLLQINNNIQYKIDLRFEDEDSLLLLGFEEIANNINFSWTDHNQCFNKKSFSEAAAKSKNLHKIFGCGEKTFQFISC